VANSAEATVTGSFATVAAIVETSPATAAAWDREELDGAQFGVELTE
jgi:hypothetical protein